MECWLITSRAEVMRLEFGDEPPPEICLPDKPLSEIEDNAAVIARSLQLATTLPVGETSAARDAYCASKRV